MTVTRLRKLLSVTTSVVSPHLSVRTMTLSNFKKTLNTPFVGAFQMISDPIGDNDMTILLVAKIARCVFSDGAIW